MDEIKSKILDLIHKQGRTVKIPAMGFSDYFIQNLSINPLAIVPVPVSPSNAKASTANSGSLSDQEILESTEPIYFGGDVEPCIYELKKFEINRLACESIEQTIITLKQQHKVVSKKVLQLILEQRLACMKELTNIGETEKKLEEAIWVCKKARSYLNFAKKNLTSTSLEILATYKKREKLIALLQTLRTIKRMKSTDQQLQQLLAVGNFSNAISLLVECRDMASKDSQYDCVLALSEKLQETLLLTEVKLDTVLSEMPHDFDTKKYSKLQEAYKILGKSIIVMDQLHMNFISAIHTTAFTILRNNVEQKANDEQQKLLFEQLCEIIPSDKYIACLLSLCKAFWTIIVCYYQVTMWHQNYKLFVGEMEASEPSEPSETHEAYIEQKLKQGQFRIWNDIQAKICTYLSCLKVQQLKFEQFIQVLSIVQRFRKIGIEFCGSSPTKLLDVVRRQSLEFFKRYHSSCLEEIGLFLENEAWVGMNSYTTLLQLQEYHTVRKALLRYQNIDSIEGGDSNISSTPFPFPLVATSTCTKSYDNDSSALSQDGSSIYGSCGYFLRFSEKSTPFDGGLDEAMLEEDILAGIADIETSCYYSEESEDDDIRRVTSRSQVAGTESENVRDDSSVVTMCNTSLTVLRCIGRYLQMCRLLHSIAPEIIISMTELIDFYIACVLEIFGKDMPFAGDNISSIALRLRIKHITETVVPKVRNFPPPTSIIDADLANTELTYGLASRIVAVESCVCLVKQFHQLKDYLEHLLGATDKQIIANYFNETFAYVEDVRKPVFLCVTSRVLDLQSILTAMAKIKWDINHVTVQHSSYIDNITRAIQNFAMRLEEIGELPSVPRSSIWDSLAHVLTHLLVEGFSNAKKCSTGGRALMQLDFVHFVSIFELISAMKHPVHQSYVETYVKAYYFPKDLLEQWIVEQRDKNDYSTKQLIGLINCACTNDKKMRQKLLAFVDSPSSDMSP